jgi:hypothetical protein
MGSDLIAHIDEANALAVARMNDAQPVLIGVAPAREVIRDMEDDLILHAGPEVAWEDMEPAVRGGCIGAMLFEKLAPSPEEAEAKARDGEVRFAPCHDHGAVGAMAGVTSASMPTFIVEDRTSGQRGYCSWRDLGLVCGSYKEETIRTLHWLAEGAGPMMNDALVMMGGLDIRNVVSRALLMGDECHNRVGAATAVFTREMAPALVRATAPDSLKGELFDYLRSSDLAFVPVMMAAACATLAAAQDIPYSSVITYMGRNGVEDGLKVSGLGERWFTAPCGVVEGSYLPGFSREDSARAIGDSSVIESIGLGGNAIAAAPAHVTVRSEPGAANRYSRQMYEISTTKHTTYLIPGLGFAGTPLGLDIRKIVKTGIAPIIDSPMAHKNPNTFVGAIGFGMYRPPMEMFVEALEAFVQRYAQ